jgi:hypothetical protein
VKNLLRKCRLRLLSVRGNLKHKLLAGMRSTVLLRDGETFAASHFSTRFVSVALWCPNLHVLLIRMVTKLLRRRGQVIHSKVDTIRNLMFLVTKIKILRIISVDSEGKKKKKDSVLHGYFKTYSLWNKTTTCILR